MYPELSPKEREEAITKKHGAVFIIGIGNELGDGKPHDTPIGTVKVGDTLGVRATGDKGTDFAVELLVR